MVGGRCRPADARQIKPSVYQGTHVEHPLVDTYRAKTIEMVAEGITAYADGERICPLPVTVTGVPGALRLLAAELRREASRLRERPVLGH